MNSSDTRDSIWDGFWADIRRDYASTWPEFLAALRQIREGYWDMVAEMRQNKQFTRRMKQRATGVENPTRRQWRQALREFDKQQAAITEGTGEQE
jgi:hypothetical protein